MMDKKIIVQSARPFFPTEDIESILKDTRAILQSGYLTLGKYTEKFEQMFANYIGTKYAIATSSGTSALEIALRCLGVKNGCEVIVPTNTFLASPNSVIFAGGKPIFADIDRKTLCIDLNDVLERITNRTVGLMVVHIAGLVCPQIKELSEICKDHGLFLIEDAAHAHGAMFKEQKAGSLGDIGCFSFYATKVMTTAEGGMICTNIDEMPEKMKILRFDGIGPEGLHVKISNNWHMDELNAVLGIHQLNRLEYIVKRRNEIARSYQEHLKDMDGITTFYTPPHIRHSFYKFPVLLEDGINTEDLIKTLKSKYGVETGRVYYPPCHLQPVYKELFGYKEGIYPVAEEVLRKVVCLPVYVQMQNHEIDYVIDSFRKALSQSWS